MSERLNSFSFHHCWNQKLAIPYGGVGFSFVEECFSPSLALILGPFSTFVIILPKALKGWLTPSLTLKMRHNRELLSNSNKYPDWKKAMCYKILPFNLVELSHSFFTIYSTTTSAHLVQSLTLLCIKWWLRLLKFFISSECIRALISDSRGTCVFVFNQNPTISTPSNKYITIRFKRR